MMAFQPEEQFRFDRRLELHVPELTQDWEHFTAEEQSAILYVWETIRGRIPDKILAFEREIADLQQRMNREDDFDAVCDMTWEIAEWASRINDLNIYYRIQGDVEDAAGKAHN